MATITGDGENDNTLTGTNGDDLITGGGGNDTILGLGGNDEMWGGDAGSDSINGGDGDDTLEAVAGTLVGGDGNDFYGEDLNACDIFEADGEGIDTIYTHASSRTLPSNVELLLYGPRYSDFAGTGNELDNTIGGNDGADTLFGLDGNDELGGNGSNDSLDGGNGNDSIHGDDGDDTILGGAGDDTVQNGNGNACLAGGSGNDVLEGVGGSDTFVAAGGGQDIVVDFTHVDGDKIDLRGIAGFTNLSDVMSHATQSDSDTVIDFGNGNMLILLSVTASSLTDSDFIFTSNFPNSAPTDITLSDNSVAENSAAGTIVGILSSVDPDAGDSAAFSFISNPNALFAISGANLTVAGALDYETATSDDVVVRVTDSAGNYFDKLLTIYITNVADVPGAVITGTPGGDLIDGTHSAPAQPFATGLGDFIDGAGGNDTIDGLAGDDSVSGGDGNDVLAGSDGDDSLDGGDGDDTIAGGDGLDTLIGGIGNDSLTSDGPGSFATGDSLVGGEGNDTIDGRIGADYLRGGPGDDVYLINGGGNLIFEDAGGGTDTIEITDGAGFLTEGLGTNFERLVYDGTSPFGAMGDSRSEFFAGGSNDDTLVSNGGADTLAGHGGNDSLDAGGGNDSVDGGDGNDTIVGFNGTDSVDGGPGDDVIQLGGTSPDLNAANDSQITNVEFVWVTSGAPGTLVDVHSQTEDFQLFGGTSGDTLIGTDGSNTLLGFGGNDSLVALDGTLDALDGGTGADTMVGGKGADNYYVDDSNDQIIEMFNEGHDRVTATASYTLSANVEDLLSQPGAHIVGQGNELDNFMLGFTSDTLYGLAGNDTLEATGSSALIGGSGDDMYVVQTTAPQTITESLGEGTDTVLAAISDFTLPSNVEILHFNGDLYNAYTGVGNSADNMISADYGAANFSGLVGNDTLLGNWTGDDSLNGGIGNDCLDGGGGSDTLNGDDGNDTLIAGNGNDALDGGADSDTAVFSGTRGNYLVSQNGSTFTIQDNRAGVPDGTDQVTNVEFFQFSDGTLTADELIVGVAITGTSKADVIDVSHGIAGHFPTGGEDTLDGAGGNDSINALGGNDVLNGGGGADTLDGGAGADSMVGGAGNDTYNVDNAADTVTEASGAGRDTVFTSLNSYTLPDNVESLVFTGAGDFTGYGSQFANALTGGSGDDSLAGDLGNDTLDGGAGADTADGGAGNDTYLVDSSADIIIEAAGQGTDTVNVIASAYTVSSNIEKLTFTGIGNFGGTGNGSANTITGGVGNDTLDGAGGNDKVLGGGGDDQLLGNIGNDTLTGGLGADLLFGGVGKDRFVFTNIADLAGGPNLDVIADFSHSQSDKIDLAGIDAVSGIAGSVFSFIGAAAFSNIAGQLHYVVNGSGGVNVEGDTNGDGISDFTLVVNGVVSLIGTDFAL